MGRNLLRRKALILLACLAAARLSGESPPSGGPFPSAQGHRGEEVWAIAIPDEEVVARYVNGLLTRNRPWLQAVLDRSQRYRGIIGLEIEARGLPRELAFLPAVESGFQSRALSRAGAMGLWQLMRNTSIPSGLRTDIWLDERRDFWKATEASLDKLEDDYRQFGDWPLALAAYNCGAGRVSRILRKSPGADYWSLRAAGLLPRDTAAFVPQFLALARILGYPGRYGLAVSWEPTPEWTRIPLDRCVDLRILARESGVPSDALFEGNKELNFPVTPPKSYRYALKVPLQYAEAVERALREATMPLLDFSVHVVQEGDTLWGLARRYGVSMDLIIEFNPTLKPRALKLGAKILVPTIAGGKSG